MEAWGDKLKHVWDSAGSKWQGRELTSMYSNTHRDDPGAKRLSPFLAPSLAKQGDTKGMVMAWNVMDSLSAENRRGNTYASRKNKILAPKEKELAQKNKIAVILTAERYSFKAAF